MGCLCTRCWVLKKAGLLTASSLVLLGPRGNLLHGSASRLLIVFFRLLLLLRDLLLWLLVARGSLLSPVMAALVVELAPV